jgi:hypothetical protein
MILMVIEESGLPSASFATIPVSMFTIAEPSADCRDVAWDTTPFSLE